MSKRDNNGDKIKKPVDVKNTEELSESKMFQNVLLSRLQFLSMKIKYIPDDDHIKNIDLIKHYLDKSQTAYDNEKFNKSKYYLQHAENIFYYEQDYNKSGLRKRRKHLEMAGALPESPGTDGLTMSDLPDEIISNIFSMMDIQSLLVVAKVCKRWKQLWMMPCVWEYAWLKVTETNYEEITKHALPLVGKYLKNVKLINLKLSLLTNYCPYLTRIELYPLDKSIDKRVFEYLHHWPNLKFLRFIVYNINPDCNLENSLPLVAKYLKTVKISCLNYDLSKATQFRASLISYCPNLTHLEISWSKVGSSIFDDLHHWPDLKVLSFYKTVIVQPCGTDRDSTVDFPFEKLKHLETLILPECSLTRNSLYNMLKCKNLVSINMIRMKNIPADFLESLFKIKQSTLRSLYIYGETLNDDIMRHISNCRQLQVLCIDKCHGLSDYSLLHLARLKNLQSLQLFHGEFAISAMDAYLTNNTFQQMKFLRLPRLYSTYQVIKIFKMNAPNLKSFYNVDGRAQEIETAWPYL